MNTHFSLLISLFNLQLRRPERVHGQHGRPPDPGGPEETRQEVQGRLHRDQEETFG